MPSKHYAPDDGVARERESVPARAGGGSLGRCRACGGIVTAAADASAPGDLRPIHGRCDDGR